MFGWAQKEKDAALLKYLEDDDVRKFVKTLKNGANPNMPFARDGADSLLQFVIEKGNSYKREQRVMALLRAGHKTNIYVRRYSGDAAEPLVFYAAYCNDQAMLEQALKSGAQDNVRNAKGQTLFGYVFSQGWLDKAELLRSHGWLDVSPDARGMTPLGELFLRGGYSISDTVKKWVPVLLAAGDAIPFDQRDGHGYTFLHRMVSGGYADLFEWALDLGFDITARTAKDESILSLAAKNGTGMLSRVLRRKADWTAKDMDAALLAAAERGDAAGVDMMLEHSLVALSVIEQAYRHAVRAYQSANESYNEHCDDWRRERWDDDGESAHMVEEASERMQACEKILARLMPLRDPADVAQEAEDKRKAEIKAEEDRARRMKEAGIHYQRIDDFTIEMTTGSKLTTTFNFLMKTVTHRDFARPDTPMVVQNFSEFEGAEAIDHARAKLVTLGGKPPQDVTRTRQHLHKRPFGG